MTASQQLIVFSDLDGTLLDHESYSWDAARPAVEALRRHDIPLVPVTSKTRPELRLLREELDNHHPYIVENGAAMYIPAGYFAGFDDAADACGEHLISTGPARNELQESLKHLRSEGEYRFKSFAELGAREISWLTGLSLDAAENANRRAASEPLLWQDSESQLEAFSSSLLELGLRCVRGGRFVHVMGQFDKGDAVARLAGLYAQKYTEKTLFTVALGDGPNDLQMLAEADLAVVVKGRHAYDMPLKSHSRVTHTSMPGPVGWNDAILNILEEHLVSA